MKVADYNHTTSGILQSVFAIALHKEVKPCNVLKNIKVFVSKCLAGTLRMKLSFFCSDQIILLVHMYIKVS